jgi:hypothetical protein
MKSNKQRINLVGYVISTDWDTEGDITQIAIETDDFETYLIEKDDVGLKLFDFINKEVGLEGVITGEDPNGYQIIKVAGYKLIETEDDEEDDEDDDDDDVEYEDDELEDYDFDDEDFDDDDDDDDDDRRKRRY